MRVFAQQTVMIRSRFARYITALCLVYSQACGFTSFESAPDEIPGSEWEAEIAAARGTFDSALLDQIRPFYAQPLNVSLGELEYLRGIEQLSADDLSIGRTDIARFEPWTDSTIEAFFITYPQLRAFRPVLVFSDSPNQRIGQAKVLSSPGLYQRPSRHSIRVAVDPHRAFRFYGRIKLDNTHARWGRRSVRLRLGEAVKISLGNYVWRFSDGLSYGYFPHDNQQDSLAANWRYGGSHSWNGCLLTSNALKMIEPSAVYHDRPAERIMGAAAAVRPHERLALGIGGSQLIVRDSSLRDSLFYAHTSAQFGIKPWRFKAYADWAIGEGAAIPFGLNARRAKRGSSVRIGFVALPGRYPGARSAWRQKAYSRLDYEDTAAIAVKAVECVLRESLGAAAHGTSAVTYMSGGGRSRVAASVGMRRRGFADVGIRYRLSATNFDSHLSHSIRLSFEKELTGAFGLSGRVLAERTSRNTMIVSAAAKGEWRALPALRLCPGIACGIGNGGPEVVLGCAQRLHLFENSGGQLVISIPVLSTNKEPVLSAQSEFRF